MLQPLVYRGMPPLIAPSLDYSVYGPPVDTKPDPAALQFAQHLTLLSIADQTAQINALRVRAEAGSLDAKRLMSNLLKLSDVLATNQGGTKPAIGKLFLSKLPDLAFTISKIVLTKAIPGVNIAFMVADVAKMITNGKVDVERWYTGTISRLIQGDIAEAAGFLVKEWYTGARALFIDSPINLVKDIWRVFSGQEMPGWAAWVLFPPLKLIQEILDFFEEIFGGPKPCMWMQKEACRLVDDWDGRKAGWGGCCNPRPSGIGVMLAEHTNGFKAFPGTVVELAAGDYVSDSTDNAADMAPLVPGQPNFSMGMQGVSCVLVPPAYKVRAFSTERFEGRMVELGPGIHNMEDYGLNDGVHSVQVRGAWTVFDARYGTNLLARRSGWVTSFMPRDPSREEVMALVLRDPNRPLDMESFDQPMRQGQPTWAPDFMERLKVMGIDNHPLTRDLLDKLNVSSEDMEASTMVARYLKKHGMGTLSGAPHAMWSGRRYHIQPS